MIRQTGFLLEFMLIFADFFLLSQQCDPVHEEIERRRHLSLCFLARMICQTDSNDQWALHREISNHQAVEISPDSALFGKPRHPR